MAGASPAQGHDRSFCGARKRQGEGTCHRPAGWGTPHPGTGNCKLHGGCTRDQITADTVNRAYAELAQLDVLPVGDPLEQLAILAGQVLAWRDSMADRINALGSLRYESAEGGEQLRAEVSLWERALDRCERVLTAMARLNIGERMAKVSEAQLELMEKALRYALDDAGLGLEEQDRAANVFTRHLRAA